MAELLTAISNLLWPILVLAIVLVFRGAVGRILRTLERRELELEVGGQRLTAKEINEQQNDLISDLQRQVGTMRRQLEALEQGPGAPPPLPAQAPSQSYGQPQWQTQGQQPGGERTPGEPPQEPAPDAHVWYPAQASYDSEPFSVLWVDDHRSRIAFMLDQLKRNNVNVVVVGTTAEALEQVDTRRFRLIISDMGRHEEGKYQADAGLEFLRALRDMGIDTPVVIYTSKSSLPRYTADARERGAVAVTSSQTDLDRHFRSFGLLPAD